MPVTKVPVRTARSIGRAPHAVTGLRDQSEHPASDRPGDEVRLGDIVLRNRLVTSSSLLGYGVSNSGLPTA